MNYTANTTLQEQINMVTTRAQQATSLGERLDCKWYYDYLTGILRRLERCLEISA